MATYNNNEPDFIHSSYSFNPFSKYNVHATCRSCRSYNCLTVKIVQFFKIILFESVLKKRILIKPQTIF